MRRRHLLQASAAALAAPALHAWGLGSDRAPRAVAPSRERLSIVLG